MASLPSSTSKVVERSYASPPAGSVANTCLPLSFFDLPFLICRPMQRLFFYQLPYAQTDSILHSLKISLSLTLQTFYPFAAKLIFPPSPQKPHILYTDGDSIPFTVVESSADFDKTIAYSVRDVQDLHPFVPQLPGERVINNTRVLSLLAVQVTVFPNSGLCIGATFSHVVADGRSFNTFMKFWASMNSAEAAGGVDKPMPFLDRNAIQEKDPCGLESVFLNDLWTSCASNSGDTKDQVKDILADKVRVIFVMGRADIERLKLGILNKCGSELPRASTFVVACAFVWTCLIKTQQFKKHDHQDDEFYYFCFVADCRNRPELDIPATYFGNCLAICFVRMMRSELVAEDGVLAATRAIGKRVEEFENGALRGAEKWLDDWTEISATGRLLTVAGSPKLRAYGTDFGWGRPKKTEVVHVEYSGAVHIGDCGHEESAIEIGLALKRDEMEAFSGFFEQGLKAI